MESAADIPHLLLQNVTTAVTSLFNGSDVEVSSLKSSGAPFIKKIHDILIIILLVSVMFSMGTAITWDQVWGHMKRPFGVIIGMLSQFLLLPLAAFILIQVLDINSLHAAGLLILASSPGGVTSNVFTYFCDGDLSLSVTMTTMSTICALFFLPFNVWLYGSSLETEAVIIPYTKMSLSLLFLTIPVLLGMLFRWKWPRIASVVTKVGSFSGFGIIVICQTLEVFIFPDIFSDVPWSIYIAEILLPLLGLSLGYLTATLFRQNHVVRRTIAIEAGIQNVGTALAIVSLSYPFDQLRKVWVFPFLYAFTMLGICMAITGMYQLQKRLFAGKSFQVNTYHMDKFTFEKPSTRGTTRNEGEGEEEEEEVTSSGLFEKNRQTVVLVKGNALPSTANSG